MEEVEYRMDIQDRLRPRRRERADTNDEGEMPELVLRNEGISEAEN
jgi:hypothetical protein